MLIGLAPELLTIDHMPLTWDPTTPDAHLRSGCARKKCAECIRGRKWENWCIETATTNPRSMQPSQRNVEIRWCVDKPSHSAWPCAVPGRLGSNSLPGSLLQCRLGRRQPGDAFIHRWQAPARVMRSSTGGRRQPGELLVQCGWRHAGVI